MMIQSVWKNLTGLLLIPAEHLWCDFKCRPWAKNSSPNTNDLYIWVPSFHTLQNCCNRCGNKFFKYMNYVSIFVGTVWKCPFPLLKKGVSQDFYPYNECTSHSKLSHYSLLNLYTNIAQMWTYCNKVHPSKIIQRICNMWEFDHFFLNHNFD